MSRRFPKLYSLKVKNFRCIGSEAVTVDLDDIVVLVGGNNAGKSTILRAYELAVSSEKMSLDDFYNKKIDSENLPEVEIHTLVDGATAPKIDLWCEPIGEDRFLVKERWIWKNTKDKPSRVGMRVDKGEWAADDDKPKMPWATDNVASARRPKAHRVSTFDSPETQSEAVKQIVNVLLEDRIRNYKPTTSPDDYNSLVNKFDALKKEFTDVSKAEVGGISENITQIVERVIPGYEFKFTIDESYSDDSLKVFDSSDINISFGDKKIMLPIENHGSGARRTILWAVLKTIAEMGYQAKQATRGNKYQKIEEGRSHLLLMDEPEISLHPKAIREACDVLYSLPETERWQVMLTTHSPQFIDLTRDHTTIVRVEKNATDVIQATTLYRPESISLTTDEKENLKLLNLVDPHMLEFFFGGKVLLVEGDTEYSAFNYIIEKEKELGNEAYSDLLIIRARGKVQIASLMKILNHFKKKYFVLHDTDVQRTFRRKTKTDDSGREYIERQEIANPAWTNNKKIQDAMTEHSTVYASLVNFEVAYFGESVEGGKPLNAIEKINQKEHYSTIKSLLDGILFEEQLPDNSIKWKDISELEKSVSQFMSIHVEELE
ncbi:MULTISPECIES: ATP-dependent endonuclease [unclassified Vibrio]|uniref:ATP-dependent nuclease n=1 Tax=unclassified Vibrio TaxID=2614977 RepID=UPI001268F6D8|nr:MULTISPECIES: AAA family ATPase [unclassified Vibrio]QFT36378.1 hypothetical protein FIU99_08030 [Vibrio sp. THAF64]QGM34279.1 hypothetical protein GGC04_08045 [Vibrio sp. THAF191d]QGN69781.1 hypothetical protein GGC03_08050 [Vibrio sp. THAF191c]